MKKDSTKQVNKAMPHWQRWLLSLLIIVMFVGIGIFVVKRTTFIDEKIMPPYLARVMSWVAERKKIWTQPVVQLKQKNKDSEEPIHFEFYNTLPNMKITVDEPQVKSSEANLKSTKPIVAASITKTLKSISNKPPPIVDANELEREFSAQLHAPLEQYIVQLGLFRNKTSAENYRAKLITAGFNAVVIKNVSTYRLQLGPFVSKDKAKNLQHQLLKIGVNSIIRKLTSN